MEQDQLFPFDNDKPKNRFDLGKGLILEVKENYPRRAILSQNGIVIKPLSANNSWNVPTLVIIDE